MLADASSVSKPTYENGQVKLSANQDPDDDDGDDSGDEKKDKSMCDIKNYQGDLLFRHEIDGKQVREVRRTIALELDIDDLKSIMMCSFDCQATIWDDRYQGKFCVFD